ncbi:MAG: hypothetical protein ACRDRK_01180 [Pseudonocardia sp.]
MPSLGLAGEWSVAGEVGWRQGARHPDDLPEGYHAAGPRAELHEVG